MSRFLRLPPRGRSGPWLVALGIALILAIQPMWPDRTAVAVAGAIALTMVAAARWQLRWLPVVVLVACAVVLRLSVINRESSDVSDVTWFAILSATHGGNPYGVGYYVSRPPGAAFPYGPVALLWYLPAGPHPATLELLVSIGLTAYFGYRAANGRPIGLAIFAMAPPLVLAAIDGSNDTSAGLLILLAIVLAERRPALGAVALAVAVAFKPYAIAWLPPLIAWAGIPALLAFAGASVLAWSPVLFVWGAGSYLKSLSMAQGTHLRESYWSLAAVLDSLAPGLATRALETLRYFASGAVAIIGALRVRTIDGVIVVGAIAFVIAQFGGYFGSYVYLAALAPLLCWRVDDWVRRGLPELQRAYGEVPLGARRQRRPAVVPAPAPAPPGLRPSPAARRLAGALHATPTSRGSRSSRNPTG